MRFSVDCRRHRIHRRFEGALTRTYTRALLGLAPLRPLLYSAAQPKSRGGSFSFRIREEPAPERRPCQLSSGTGGVAGLGSPCCAPLERCSTMVTRGCKQKLSAQEAAARVLREAMEPSP